MAMSKAFKGVHMPAPYILQKCGHKFRATGGSAPICPVCRTDIRRKKPAAPRLPLNQVHAAVKALVLAGDGVIDMVQAQIEVERLLIKYTLLSDD